MPNVDLVKSDVIILGNLNTNMMSNSKLPKNDKHELLNFSGTFDLTQLIKEPTRITDTSRALIDLIFVNNDHRVVKSGVIPVLLSDHYLVFCILKAAVFIKAQLRSFEYRSYKNFDANLFNDELRNVPWRITENEWKNETGFIERHWNQTPLNTGTPIENWETRSTA